MGSMESIPNGDIPSGEWGLVEMQKSLREAGEGAGKESKG